ncbi:porin [Segetibacter sp. 3557_3]|nr:porin [Segetibacter sp. 3557_3]TDH20088.1 porin [Segetibacter sp. 3557_3]
MKKFSFIIVIVLGSLFPCVTGRAQDTSTQKPTLESRVYLDAYYSYDFSKPATHQKAPFLYNYNRHNEVNINLALASLSYKRQRARATLGLMTGTYAQYNLADEPQVLRHVFEANAGVKLSAHENLWLDAGILPSHIGYESAISKDCWTLTRSILAENSPYYEAGARLSYTTINKKWYAAILLLNGWQRITRRAGNNTPSLGTQLTYTPSDNLSINWSTFVGNNEPDSARQWRYFNNLYAVWKLNKALGFTIGFDYGMQQKQRGSSNFNTWYSPVFFMPLTFIAGIFSAMKATNGLQLQELNTTVIKRE